MDTRRELVETMLEGADPQTYRRWRAVYDRAIEAGVDDEGARSRANLAVIDAARLMIMLHSALSAAERKGARVVPQRLTREMALAGARAPVDDVEISRADNAAEAALYRFRPAFAAICEASPYREG